MSRFRRIAVLAVCCVFVLMTSLALAAGDPATPTPAKDAPAKATDTTAKKVQTTCPITGDKIVKEYFVDKDGKRIYVCCSSCLTAVKKDFDKIAKKMEAEGIDLTIPKDAAKPEAPK